MLKYFLGLFSLFKTTTWKLETEAAMLFSLHCSIIYGHKAGFGFPIFIAVDKPIRRTQSYH